MLWHWTKGQSVALWAPLAFAFCATLAAASVLLEPKPVLEVCRIRFFLPTGSVFQPGPTQVAMEEWIPETQDASTQHKVVLEDLPGALRRPMRGPKIFIPSSHTPSVVAKTKAKPRPSKRTKPARLVLRSLAKDTSRLDYKVGRRLRPEVVRLSSRSQIRVLVSADRASQRRLKRYHRQKKGLKVSVQPLGADKLAIKLQCDRRCRLGEVQASRQGWSIRIHHPSSQALALRR